MADLIDRWSADSMELVNAAVAYAKGNVFDENADSNIRAVRVMCQVLLQAASQAQIPRPADWQQPQAQAAAARQQPAAKK
jgi:hypothetical protein